MGEAKETISYQKPSNYMYSPRIIGICCDVTCKMPL